MASVNVGIVTYPDNPNDITDKIVEYLGWTATIEQTDEADNVTVIPNPETKLQCVKRKIREYLKECYKAQKAKDADSYRKQAIEDAESIIFS